MMTESASQDRNEIFSFRAEELGFDAAVLEIITTLIEEQRDTVLAPENVISYSHGEGWLSFQEEEKTEKQVFQEQTHEEVIAFQDILDHNISLLQTYILKMVKGVHEQFMHLMYQRVHEAAKRTGNLLDAKEYSSTAEAFIEMLRKIEFGVDRSGEVSRPQIHLGKEMYEKFQSDIALEGDEFRNKVEEMTTKKEAAALEREANRKARFPQLSEDK